MKVYLAKDWTGSHVFAEPPKLMKCGGMPDIWSGHKLNIFDIIYPCLGILGIYIIYRIVKAILKQ